MAQVNGKAKSKDTVAKPAVLLRSTSEIPLPSETNSSPSASKQVDASKKRKRNSTVESTPKPSKKVVNGSTPTLASNGSKEKKDTSNNVNTPSTPKPTGSVSASAVPSSTVVKSAGPKKHTPNAKKNITPASKPKDANKIPAPGKSPGISTPSSIAKGTSDAVSAKEGRETSTQGLSKRQKKQLNKAEKEAKIALNKARVNATTNTSVSQPSSTDDQIAKASEPNVSLSNGSIIVLNALQRLEARFTAMAERHIAMSEQFEKLRKEQHDQTVEIARLTKILWEERSKAG